jgi:hypothetical protein
MEHSVVIDPAVSGKGGREEQAYGNNDTCSNEEPPFFHE